MRIGFIGLGAMGRHMAANVQRAGHAVQAHDLRRVEGSGTGRRAPPRRRGCEVVFTSLPGPKEVGCRLARDPVCGKTGRPGSSSHQLARRDAAPAWRGRRSICSTRR